jgi:hypothetical protein
MNKMPTMPLRGTSDRIELAAARKMISEMMPWARLGVAIMKDWPEGCDLDGGQVCDIAEKAGVLFEIEGGFDPERHEDTYGIGADAGDPWFDTIPVPVWLKSEDEIMKDLKNDN